MAEKLNVYFLTGLGADSRMFRHLQLPAHVNPVFLEWIAPQKQESLREYGIRISEKIDQGKPYVLVGLSFGGILASEMNTFLKPRKTILISSVARASELPWYYRLSGVLKLNALLPAGATRKANPLLYYFFDVKDAAEKALLNEVLANTDPVFSKWAVGRILNWDNRRLPENLVRIHGSRDRILPVTSFTPQYMIKGGGHLVVMNRAEEISEILGKELV